MSHFWNKTECKSHLIYGGNWGLKLKRHKKFVCLLSNDIQFNPQVISFSTVYNSPYKKLEKIGKFRFFPKKNSQNWQNSHFLAAKFFFQQLIFFRIFCQEDKYHIPLKSWVQDLSDNLLVFLSTSCFSRAI